MIPTHHKKRNMVLDSMRFGGGRCPPLIVSILLLVCFILLFNWWSLSTENVELMNQLDQLQEQLKITVEERDKCLPLKDNFEQQYKNIESEAGALHVRLQKLDELKKHNDELTYDLTFCKSELDSLTKLDVTKTATLEAQRLEKDSLTSQLDTKREESLKLISELNQTKSDMEQLKRICNKNNEGKKKEVIEKNTRNPVKEMGDEKKTPDNLKENVGHINTENHTTPQSVSPPQFGNVD